MPVAPMQKSKGLGAGPSLKNVSKRGRARPNRAVLYAPSGWGKTSLAAHLPDPLVLMTKGEDGLRTLLGHGLVPETQHFDDEATTWNELMLGVNAAAAADEPPCSTFVLDTLNGAAQLCVEHVTQVEFEGSSQKFNDYSRGWKVVPQTWQKLIDALGRINEKGVSVMLLAHADVKTFKNPEGTDYDRFTPRMAPQLWEPVEQWADMVLFGQLETFVQTDRKDAKKGKAVGSQDRMLYCERTAVADAKNRHGLPPMIHLGQGAENAWNALAKAVEAGRKADHKKGGPE